MYTLQFCLDSTTFWMLKLLEMIHLRCRHPCNCINYTAHTRENLANIQLTNCKQNNYSQW